MNRSKIVAIVTGVISILLAIAYLILVQLLDFRGEMLPAPQELGGTWCVFSVSFLPLAPSPFLGIMF